MSLSSEYFLPVFQNDIVSIYIKSPNIVIKPYTFAILQTKEQVSDVDIVLKNSFGLNWTYVPPIDISCISKATFVVYNNNNYPIVLKEGMAIASFVRKPLLLKIEEQRKRII